MDREEVMKEFVSLFIDRILVSHGKDFRLGLETGLPGNSNRELSNWYKGLNESDRANVIEASNSSARTFFCGILCILDGISGFGRSDDMFTQ